MPEPNARDSKRPFDVLHAPRTAREIIRKFCLLSSVRGVPRIYKARNKKLRFLWATTVFVFLIFTMLQVTDVVFKYLHYQTVQEQKVQVRTSSKFPDVTLCSLQPFPTDRASHGRVYSKVETLISNYFYAVKDKLQGYDEEEDKPLQEEYEDVDRDDLDYHYGDEGGEEGGEDFYNDIDDPHFKEMENSEETVKKRKRKRKREAANLVPRGDNGSEPIIDEETLESILLTTAGFYQNLNDSTRESLGLYGPGSFIQSCSFTLKDDQNLRTENCKVGVFHHPQYFNCYTARLANEGGNVLKMSLRLFLNDSIQLFYPNDYHTNVDSQLHGVKVVIHEPGSYPDVVQKGYDVPPGMAAKFFLHTTIKKLLPEPYGKCNHDSSAEIRDHNRVYRYEQQTCIDQCTQHWINKVCKCTDPWIVQTDHPKFKNLPFCASLNTTLPKLRWRLACMYDYEFRPPPICDCDLPCRRHEYNTILSLSKWPHESHHIQIRNSMLYGNTSEGEKNTTFDFDAMFDHLMKHKEDLFREHWSGKYTQATLEAAKEKAKKLLMDTDVFQRNFVSVTVLRDTFEVLVIKENPETSFGALLSKIGGSLSFWLGITLITLLESVELVYDCVGVLLSKCSGEKGDDVTNIGDGVEQNMNDDDNDKTTV